MKSNAIWVQNNRYFGGERLWRNLVSCSKCSIICPVYKSVVLVHPTICKLYLKSKIVIIVSEANWQNLDHGWIWVMVHFIVITFLWKFEIFHDEHERKSSVSLNMSNYIYFMRAEDFFLSLTCCYVFLWCCWRNRKCCFCGISCSKRTNPILIVKPAYI